MAEINFNHLKEWFALSELDRREIFTQVAYAKGLPTMAIEKDWWVVNALAITFSLDISLFILFKGGTSLSKCWRIIERFSEDIDLSIDRSYFGFGGELERSEIRKLRKVSFQYLTTEFVEKLQEKFKEVGFNDVVVKARDFPNHDQDPVIIEILYGKIIEQDDYLKPGIILEIGSRSLKEPYSTMDVTSFVAEAQVSPALSNEVIKIPAVNPERTFLEKVFLIHETLAGTNDQVRTDRMSRHLYDLIKISKTRFAEIAFNDPDLYSTIVHHRNKYTRISGIDYKKHQPAHIKIVPGEEVVKIWQSDYDKMRELMIFGEAPSFRELIEELKQIQSAINQLPDVELVF